MTLQQRRLARSRLGLGITNVGFWVLLAAGGLFWLAGRDTRGLDLFRLGVILLTAVAAQSVFDFVGGAWLMPEPRPSVKTFLRGWAPGAVAHTLVLAGVGLLSYASFQRSGGFCPAIGAATAGLALGRRHLLRAVAGVSTAEMQRAIEPLPESAL
ncbi:MAG: hypothetical protein KF791_05365 [Verrucomicrobiae bacterium]|nr:hypothetical protein [Verrucomicrobiae bacterium]